MSSAFGVVSLLLTVKIEIIGLSEVEGFGIFQRGSHHLIVLRRGKVRIGIRASYVGHRADILSQTVLLLQVSLWQWLWLTHSSLLILAWGRVISQGRCRPLGACNSRSRFLVCIACLTWWEIDGIKQCHDLLVVQIAQVLGDRHTIQFERAV